MSYRTPLGRVRGLGSAKGGTHHWWMQRLTAVALVPLTVWFILSLITLSGADHATVAAWLASPLPAVLMILLIVATFHHLQLGLQVIIEDYVHGEGMRLACIIGVKLASFALAVAAGFAVLKVAF
ncbi:MAG: succinate dehydrogenase, hydrophobic membrane anchor protein [Alphaproteobacteria bacterium]|nr:succinate dehydrogenase, hydrophobic membrane anchor protein [Alphaproteobacteria bacterium]